MRPSARARLERLGTLLALTIPWCLTTAFVFSKTASIALREWPWMVFLSAMIAGSAALIAYCVWTAFGLEEWKLGPHRLDRTRGLFGIRLRQHFSPTALIVRGYLTDEPQPRLWCLSVAQADQDRLSVLESGSLDQMRDLGRFAAEVCDLPLKEPATGLQGLIV
jgi:hypothetical protein